MLSWITTLYYSNALLLKLIQWLFELVVIDGPKRQMYWPKLLSISFIFEHIKNGSETSINYMEKVTSDECVTVLSLSHCLAPIHQYQGASKCMNVLLPINFVAWHLFWTGGNVQKYLHCLFHMSRCDHNWTKQYLFSRWSFVNL